MGDSEKLSVVVFAKEKPGLEHSLSYLRKYSDDIILFKGERVDAFPEAAYDLYPDLTLSYISPWIIPQKVLENTQKWAINFHPGPPEYPGIGCTNFAIYNKEKCFGITAHLMVEKVDTGKILSVRRFATEEIETVHSLTQKCYKAIQILFQELMDEIFIQGHLNYSNEEWARKPYTRRELNALCKIDCRMGIDEINRRVKATYYPGMPGAYIKFGNHVFKYSRNKDKEN